MYSLFPGDCEPFAMDEKKEKPIVPCGAIANSLFNGRCNFEFREPDDVSFDDFFLNSCPKIFKNLGVHM